MMNSNPRNNQILVAAIIGLVLVINVYIIFTLWSESTSEIKSLSVGFIAAVGVNIVAYIALLRLNNFMTMSQAGDLLKYAMNTIIAVTVLSILVCVYKANKMEGKSKLTALIIPLLAVASAKVSEMLLA